MSPRSQKPKGKARPRRFHHGRSAGRINDKALREVETHYAEAQADLEGDSEAERLRQEIAEFRADKRALSPVAPAVLDPGAFAALCG